MKKKNRMKSTILLVSVIAVLSVSAGSALFYYHQGFQKTAAQGLTIEQRTQGVSEQTSTTVQQVRQFITEYPTPTQGSLPNGVAVDSSGNVWTVLQNQTALGEFSLVNETFRVFVLPEQKGTLVVSWGIAVDNARHLVWFTDETSNSIWRFDITAQSFRQFVLMSPGALPFQVALDSQGNAWFTEFGADKIGEISPGGAVIERSIPLAPAQPIGIAVDTKQDRIWFNLFEIGRTKSMSYIGSYYKGSFTFRNITVLAGTPVGIALDPMGNIWLTQHGTSFLSEYNPSTGYFRTISTSVPPAGVSNLYFDYVSNPYFVYADPASNLWFNEHYGNAIGEFNPSTNQMVEYLIPSKLASNGNISGVVTMNLTPSGMPWFSEQYTGKLGTINARLPVGLSLKVDGTDTRGRVIMKKNSSVILQLSIIGASDKTEYLSAGIGNYTESIQFKFGQITGNGDFVTSLEITNAGSAKGVYQVTISVKTDDLIVSQVIEILTA